MFYASTKEETGRHVQVNMNLSCPGQRRRHRNFDGIGYYPADHCGPRGYEEADLRKGLRLYLSDVDLRQDRYCLPFRR